MILSIIYELFCASESWDVWELHSECETYFVLLNKKSASQYGVVGAFKSCCLFTVCSSGKWQASREFGKSIKAPHLRPLLPGKANHPPPSLPILFYHFRILLWVLLPLHVWYHWYSQKVGSRFCRQNRRFPMTPYRIGTSVEACSKTATILHVHMQNVVQVLIVVSTERHRD